MRRHVHAKKRQQHDAANASMLTSNCWWQAEGESRTTPAPDLSVMEKVCAAAASSWARPLVESFPNDQEYSPKYFLAVLGLFPGHISVAASRTGQVLHPLRRGFSRQRGGRVPKHKEVFESCSIASKYFSSTVSFSVKTSFSSRGELWANKNQLRRCA